ncbi:hypothetical protein, partial [Cupriavidus plantarum]|uniref:hypothetical protein n=1 Tax=Cupriavidus plantarum TaxID=942865 RepID=UPI0038B3C321
MPLKRLRRPVSRTVSRTVSRPIARPRLRLHTAPARAKPLLPAGRLLPRAALPELAPGLLSRLLSGP